jgi:glycosyltransferase involved in cell wall biosynthesis
VTLVVADDLGNAQGEQVRIVDVGRLEGRANRMLRTTRRVLDQAVALQADIYHLHDPELIPAGLRLKRMGKTVVFDSHEDVPSQLLGKPYLLPAARRFLSRSMSAYERYACAQLDGVIAATPFIRDKFLRIHPHTIDVNNFPLLSEFDEAAPWTGKAQHACYVGGISAMRGIRELVRACALLHSPARLQLAGSFGEPGLEAEVSKEPGWQRVDPLGHLDRADVGAVMARSMVGLVTLHPVVNYLDALPVKMFEYMAAGIPVIASDFPLWRDIIMGNGCGICVDPFNPHAIANAVDALILNPDRARAMGENGRQAVARHYNWDAESAKLIGFYAHL